MYQTGSVPRKSNSRPDASRTELGPSSGSTKYGPGASPQRPSVWPKSSLLRGAPALAARSKQPSRPAVLFQKNRDRSTIASPGFACSRSLMALTGSPRLRNALLTQWRTGSGSTAS